MMESESGFNLPGAAPADRVPVGTPGQGRYDFFRTRLHGKLHFEKRVSARYLADVMTVEALRKEFEVGYGLEHPGVVRYLFCEPGALYQEYIDGDTLRQMIDNNDPRLRQGAFLRDVVSQLLEALRYIHRHGVLHLDIKPENVMVERIGGRVKLIDFGCARTGAFDITEGYSLAYKAPEQGGGETNTYTDIYLVGRLMRELTDAAGLRKEWRRFLRKCYAESPADRFRDDDEALAALPGARRNRGALKRTMLTAGATALLCVALFRFLAYEPLPRSPRYPIGVPGDAQEETAPEESSLPTTREGSGLPATTTETGDESASQPSGVNGGESASQPSASAHTRAQIERQLETEIQKIYKTRFIDPADRWLAEGGDPSYHPTLRDALEKAHEEADAVADRLADRYPADRTFIESKTFDLNNLYQSKIGGYLEKGWKVWEQGEGREEVKKLRKNIEEYYPL